MFADCQAGRWTRVQSRPSQAQFFNQPPYKAVRATALFAQPEAGPPESAESQPTNGQPDGRPASDTAE